MDDIERIVDVIADGRRAMADLGIDQWQDGYPRRSDVISDMDRGVAYVIADEAHDSPIAYAAIILDGEPDYDVIADGDWLTTGTSADPTYTVVHRLSVATSARRRGVASRVFSEACALAVTGGRVSVRVDTHPGNTSMQHALEANGFVRRGTILLSDTAAGTRERFAYERLVGGPGSSR
jgi:GNAT superfamily N-acetyltransferase